ncbi:MAG: shikimate dehydrogenase [Planctomycetes bacterium]|nr:shikimate dehydrogenase [Planctomycetota bacterium]
MPNAHDAPQVCIASHHGSFAELLADAEFRAAAERPDGACLVEFRVDAFADRSEAKLREALVAFTPQRCVVTYRSPEEGGRDANASDETRLAFAKTAVQAQAAFVDLEVATFARLGDRARGVFADRKSTRLIASFHDFEAVPVYDRLHALRKQGEALGADVVKIAVQPKAIHDASPLLDLLYATDFAKPLMALAMGEAGFWSRVLGPRFPQPAPFTFARGEGAPGTAPGQPIWRELLELYRFRRIGPATPVYGVIGSPIAHSLSPAMHNAALAALNLDGVFLPFRVDGEPAAFAREIAPKLGVRGLSVTIPHKETVIAAAAEIDPLARQIGAVNTLVARGGGWFATNTDAHAAAGSFEEAAGGEGALNGKTVLVLGAGGAARAVAFGIKARGAEVWLHNRTESRAEKLAQDVGARCVKREEISRQPKALLGVINTTSVGMHPNVDATPLAASEIPQGSLVFDTVYNPLRTRLLELAEGRGCRTLNGLKMFVRQGAEQFRLFTGRPAPVEVMEQVVLQALAKRG